MGINTARTGRPIPLACAVVVLGLAGCASVGPRPTAFKVPSASAPEPAFAAGLHSDPSSRTSPPARTARRAKLGAPYRANGRIYLPAAQPHYDEVGLASWYGAAFHGRATAIGERFDRTSFSAAHATLPLPCLVEVTNLDNGRRMTLRLNDRGPFHPGRIIDLSEAAATRLGYVRQGTARVRVRYIGPDAATPVDRGSSWLWASSERAQLRRGLIPSSPPGPHTSPTTAAITPATTRVSAWSEEARRRLTALVDAEVGSGGGQ